MTTVEAMNSTRFGPIEVAPQDIITFPEGLIGLPGNDYTLISAQRGPFVWLQSLSDGSLALPLTDPVNFFPAFQLELLEQDRRLLAPGAAVYVTVRATPDRAQNSANLKAPIVISGQQARQVLNLWDGAAIRVPLLGPTGTSAGEPQATSTVD